ncbi:MAG TPA: hypothetical protein VMV90_04175 [Rectinemataceae bacterium]|nr:hypothetical protein [Rectinemataceae bacterium]
MSDSKPQGGGRHRTYADYRRWPEGGRWELAGGVAYATSPDPRGPSAAPGGLHGRQGTSIDTQA